MSKIPENLENPIDRYIVKFVEYTSDTIHKIGITPNMITTARLFIGLLSIYFLLSGNYNMASILFFVSYVLDCQDGYHARKYNMMSRFGDYYDHVSDILVSSLFILILIIKLYKYRQNNFIFGLIIAYLIISVVLMASFIGCTAVHYGDKESVLSYLKLMCPNTKKMKWLKYFSSGTFIFVISLLTLYLKYTTKKIFS